MRISLNSWTFEKKLGPLRLIEWNEAEGRCETVVEPHPETLSLADWTRKLGSLSYCAMELAYAHLRDTSDEGLREFRRVADETGVQLASLLLDFGDPSTTDERRSAAERQTYREWIGFAAKAGFERVRIGAGDSRPGDRAALERSAAVLAELAAYGQELGVLVVTENLGKLLSVADNCLTLLDLTGGKVGLTADFGNFPTDKFAQLAQVLPRAVTVHAKAETTDGDRIDSADFRRCLELCRQAGFGGPLSLTYLGGGSPWERLAEMRDLAEAPFGQVDTESSAKGT